MKRSISLIILAIFSLCGCSKKEQKSFVILICSYNNEDYCDWNLASALGQKYDNYRVIYVNDMSSDKTVQKVNAFVENHPNKDKFLLLDNSERCLALKNTYLAIHNHIKDDEIVVFLDGDDALSDCNVLSYLNKVYSQKGRETWMTYGQYKLKSNGKEGFCEPIPDSVVQENGFRELRSMFSHLRTFYGWLFKEIKKEDLLLNGEFYPMTGDMAMMLPMMEMAGERSTFISRILYIYNDQNSISDHCKSKAFQRSLDLIIRDGPRYTRLEKSKIEAVL